MSSSPIRVLVVDDDEDDFVILRELLEDADASYLTEWVSTEAAGLEALSRTPFDVCFVDYLLGDRTGLDLIREANRLRIKTPMILLTGKGGREIDLEAGASGAADYLVKGQIDSTLVERSIRYTLEHHRDKEVLRNAYEELKRTQAQLIQSEKLASIGILASGLAHEINNPTAFVIGNVELLRDDAIGVREAIARLRRMAGESGGTAGEMRTELADALGDERITHFCNDSAELISDALDGALRIRSIVSGLKGFARQDRGDFRMVDVNEEVDKAVELLRNEWKYKCEVTKDQGNIPMVNGNASQIEQVLVNILLNAIQSITKPRGHIGIRTYHDEAMVCIAISDDGVGIPADCLKYIYDPFFTTKDIGAGTGLGLSIAYGIVQSHRGRMDVVSEVGSGTTFTIRIPI